MNCWEFEKKLQKLNPRLYVGRNIINTYNPELGSTGLYLKIRNPDDILTAKKARYVNFKDLGGVNQSAKTINDLEDGDTYLGMVTALYIPEGNWYNEDQSIRARGWREILCYLIKRGLVDVHKARKVFRREALGLEDYDKKSDLAKYHRFFPPKPKKYEVIPGA